MVLRNGNIEKVKGNVFDVAIIGGGITGAGIFLKCCQQGLSTVLIDKDDFASGTSSRSAKMIHGGLRYLEYLQVKLVKEALEEREYLLDRYPHLVRPLPFLLPIYDSQFTRVKMKVGLSGYDALAGNSKLPSHRSLGKDEVMKTYPMLKKKGLKGGFYYFDAITSDARLTNEVIMEGCLLGGIALNYVSASLTGESNKQLSQLSCKDELSGDEFKITADQYVSATGIWTDETLKDLPDSHSHYAIMKPSKGVHIIVDGKNFPEKDVLLIPCTDKRFIWICPWEDGMVNIGATDTPFKGDLREPGITIEDVQYLLDNANNCLEGIHLTEDDILSVYSGLRPLLNEEGEENTVKMSRDYKIWWERENLLVIAGGKLTSFLSMADSVLETLAEKTDRIGELDQGNGTQIDSATDQFADTIQMIRQEAPGNSDRLVDHLKHDMASIIFFIRYQHAEKISDVLSRRLSLTYSMKEFNQSLAERVADIMQRELNWSSSIRDERINDYKKHWEILHSWTK